MRDGEDVVGDYDNGPRERGGARAFNYSDSQSITPNICIQFMKCSTFSNMNVALNFAAARVAFALIYIGTPAWRWWWWCWCWCSIRKRFILLLRHKRITHH